MKILYIGPQMKNPRNGGDRIENRNQSLLERVSEGNIVYFTPDFSYNSIWKRLNVYIGYTVAKKIELNKILNSNHFDLIFVSQSLYGGYVKLIRKAYEIPIITFFHNVELDYFKTFKDNYSIKGLYYFIKVILSEYISVKLSTKIIAMNERDSYGLYKYYKRKADFLLPTSFEDTSYKLKTVKQDIDYLFVGSCFRANTEGLQWFIDNVMPHVRGSLYIIGNGMDKFNFLNLSSRIQIKGFVDNVADYYNRAKIVISPIFSGSGMKTKTAEALMFGKIIIGTQEAFEGYIINPDCMILCNTKDEFIEKLNSFDISKEYPQNMVARQHFLDNYSDDSMYQRLYLFLKFLY